MITEKDLREAIAECQSTRSPTANTCMKLAAYYTILDHTARNSYSYANKYKSDTEFGNIIAYKPTAQVLSVMDELMETLEIVNPQVYKKTLKRLKNL